MSDSGYSSYSYDGGPNRKLIGGIVVVLLIGAGVAVFHFKVFGDLLGSGGLLSGGKCYEFKKVAETVNQGAAARACIKLEDGWKLIGEEALNSGNSEKLDAVQGRSPAWTTMYDKAETGSTNKGDRRWVWNRSGNLFKQKVYQWCPGEPNNAGGNEFCVHLFPKPKDKEDGKPCLNDIQCEAELNLAAICAREC